MNGERFFVWLGGLMFVTSLAVCAWFYMVAWGPSPGLAPHASASGRVVRWDAVLLNALLFGVFAAHHSLFAREPVKVWLARRVPTRLQRSVYVWTASVLLILVCVSWVPVGGGVYELKGARATLHALVQAAGLLIIAGSVRAIDPLELAGIRFETTPEALQITGPYRWVRHPVYLGWIVVVFGAAHMTGDRLAFAAISTLYLVAAVPWEERSLERSFPDEYRRYQQQVRWRVLPYVF